MIFDGNSQITYHSFIHSLERHDQQKISVNDVLTIDFKLSNVHQGNPLLNGDNFRK